MHPAHHVDEVLERRDVRRASDEAPHVPVVGTSAASAPHEKLREALLYLDDIIAPHAADVNSKYPLLIPLGSRNFSGSLGRLLQRMAWGLRTAKGHSDGCRW